MTEPRYTEEEQEWAKGQGLIQDHSGWLINDNKLLLPGANQWKIAKCLHDSTHLEGDSLFQLMPTLFVGKDLLKTVKQVIQACDLCAWNNPNNQSLLPPLIRPVQHRGVYTVED